MIDPTSVRVALGVVVALSLIHTLGSVARAWSSAAPRWWGATMILTIGSLLFDLGNGTSLQWLLVPLGNGVGVAAVLCVLNATRAIRGLALPWFPEAFMIAGTIAAAAVDSPGTDEWAGSAFMYTMLAGVYSTIAVEMRLERRRRAPRGAADTRVERRSYAAFSGAGAVLGLVYVARWIDLTLEGPEDGAFGTSLGVAATALVQIAVVATVTYAMAALGESRRREELVRRATTDDLTGVLSRAELMERIHDGVADARTAPSVLIACDLDHFKELNDSWGHAAGDRALIAFTEAWRSVLAPGDLFGRLGGDEFLALLRDVDIDGARARIASVAPRLEDAAAEHVTLPPTVSYGIAVVEPETSVTVLVGRADMALYEAKAARGGAVRAHGRDPQAHEAAS
ncbi:GGDEF domain-containing protein [Demequina gelatinilytica]|uniref:GGDEF domain-containing protein n=1 Tax=Demequina gelatinilytica TaxID=1638980 RepID=UPI0007837BBF|nr:GGDEF domain-containing protein [Demequina gelatinilytica]